MEKSINTPNAEKFKIKYRLKNGPNRICIDGKLFTRVESFKHLSYKITSPKSTDRTTRKFNAYLNHADQGKYC